MSTQIAAERRARARRKADRFDAISRLAVPAAAVIGVLTLVAVAAFFGSSDGSSTIDGNGDGIALGQPAPDFTVRDVVNGGQLSRADLAGKPALIFFSEGIACQACMVQTNDLERPLEAAGVQLVTVTTDPPDALLQAGMEYGIRTPLLADDSRAMSSAYGMLGKGGMGHPTTNGHAFALLDADGDVVWERAYAEMYVPPRKLIAQVEEYAG